jgi:hypothetical protein
MFEMSFVRRERNVKCRQREMWLKAWDECVGTILLCIKNTYCGSIQITAFQRFCLSTGMFKILKFLGQNVKNN